MAKRGNPAFVKGQPNPYMRKNRSKTGETQKQVASSEKQGDRANEVIKNSLELPKNGEITGAVPGEITNGSK